MSRHLGFWTALLIVFGLLASFSLSGQANPDPAPEAAEAAVADGPTVDMQALMAMSREQRFDALRAMDRDQRIAYLRDLSREERRAFRLHKRSQLTQDSSKGYQPLPEARNVEPKAAKVAGTNIQYDSGTVTGTVTANALGRFVGNRYDSALNPAGTAIVPVERTGTITMITFEMVRTFFDTVTWSLYSNIMGTSAVQVDSVVIPVATGLNTFTVEPANTNNVYQNGPFLAGIWQFRVNSTAIGVDTGTNGGLGHHLVSINDPLTTAPNTGMGLTTLGNRNAVFRINGNLVTPIELMNFEVE